MVRAWSEVIIYDDLDANLNTQYSFSEMLLGLGHSYLRLCAYYGVRGPGLSIQYIHILYTCEWKLVGDVDLSSLSLTTYVSILATVPIYTNMYVTGMYVSPTPAFEYVHMKHT